MTIAEQISHLHGLYSRLTGFKLRLDMGREAVWFEWLRRGFTADDLQALIRHLRSEIREGRRNPGALKFSNLIGQPDFFEEDLAVLRALNRNRVTSESVVSRVVHTGDTERRLPDVSPTHDARRAAEVLESEAFKKFVDLKRSL